MARKQRKIEILGRKVREDSLQAVLKDVVAKRGLRAHLVLENEAEFQKRLTKGPGFDYANVYRYAFF